MSHTNLPKISEDLFGLVVKLNSTIFKQGEFLKTMPLPPSHVKVIFYLVHNAPTTMSDLAHHLCISKSNMTPIIDKLIDEGLVIRTENPKDRRTILIEATPKTHELFETHKQLIKQRLATRIEHLSPEDLAKLHQSIQMALPLLDKLGH
ncbi:MAG: MarR family winged helix-turn-helix transcriptional regulator [Cellulosilyticaceae bacterium]